MDAAVTFRDVDIVFGNASPKRALALLDAGKTREEIITATGQVDAARDAHRSGRDTRFAREARDRHPRAHDLAFARGAKRFARTEQGDRF